MTFKKLTEQDRESAYETFAGALEGNDGHNGGVIVALAYELEQGRNIGSPGVIEAVARLNAREFDNVMLTAEYGYGNNEACILMSDLAAQAHAKKLIEIGFPDITEETKGDWILASEGKFDEVSPAFAKDLRKAVEDEVHVTHEAVKWRRNVQAASRGFDEDLGQTALAMRTRNETLGDVARDRHPDPVRSKGPVSAGIDTDAVLVQSQVSMER